MAKRKKYEKKTGNKKGDNSMHIAASTWPTLGQGRNRKNQRKTEA